MRVQNLPEQGACPQKQILNEFLFMQCTYCSSEKILWQERVLIEGSLENYHLVHTEVEDVYQCRECRQQFSKWKQL